MSIQTSSKLPSYAPSFVPREQGSDDLLRPVPVTDDTLSKAPRPIFRTPLNPPPISNGVQWFHPSKIQAHDVSASGGRFSPALRLTFPRPHPWPRPDCFLGEGHETYRYHKEWPGPPAEIMPTTLDPQGCSIVTPVVAQTPQAPVRGSNCPFSLDLQQLSPASRHTSFHHEAGYWGVHHPPEQAALLGPSPPLTGRTRTQGRLSLPFSGEGRYRIFAQNGPALKQD